MSLKQKRILNDLEVSENPEAEDNIEDEYDRYCTAVVSIILNDILTKLFFVSFCSTLFSFSGFPYRTR